MKFKKKLVGVIIVLMTGSLLGLVSLQAYLLDKAITLKMQAFRQNVNAALGSIVRSLETRETVARALKVTVQYDQSTDRELTVMNMDQIDSVRCVNGLPISEADQCRPNVLFDSNKVILSLPSAQHVRLVVLDSMGQEINNVINEYKPAGKHEVDLPESTAVTGILLLKFDTDSSHYTMKIAGGEQKDVASQPTGRRRKLLVEKVLDELGTLSRQPIEQRINPDRLDSLIKTSLADKGIHIPYAFGILSGKKDSLVLAWPVHFASEVGSAEFRTRLFPNDIFNEKNDLLLYFPGQKVHLFSQVGMLVLAAVVLILTIVFCFCYTIRTIIKQKQFSNLLTDFINNMTHEFKTPISTIALASEALANPAVGADKARYHRYSQVIFDENLRMRNQVEKILQMAALEEGDFELNITRVDVHQLIIHTIKSVALQVENRKGKIITQFNAGSHVIEADTLHVTNVIRNLLDNAVKYNKRVPEITIITENIDYELKITVMDNGIGLRPEEQKLVFDKYYRVPTGDVHDVKGFGLGLSYVKLMVAAHGGRVGVKSELTRGSSFEVVLPVRQLRRKR